MVRVQRRVSKKSYLNSKQTYQYERMSLPIPRKYHDMVKPLLGHDFEISIATEKESITITLTPQKTVQHAANLH